MVRFLLLWGMNLYIYFASFIALLDIWGWIWTLLLTMTGPLFFLIAPLLIWGIGGDSSLILLLVLGNLGLIIITFGPVFLDEFLPKNQLINWLRLLVNGVIALVVISQGIALLNVIFFSTMFLENEVLFLITTYGGVIFAGIYGAWHFLNFTENSEFEAITTKRMLYTIAVIINVILLLNNMALDNGGAAVYTVNNLTCLLACIYFINTSNIESSLNKLDNT